MGITSNKDINELARKAIRLGWNVFVSGRNHIRWVPPDEIVQKYGKAFVTTSLTPSDNYAINQIERDLKKAGLWHLEETLAKVDLEQTQEEKYLDLGTSLPIPLADRPTLRDVAPPELTNGAGPQQEVGSMAKKIRQDRSEMRSEILRILREAQGPLSTQQLYDKLPAKLKTGDFTRARLPGTIRSINVGMPGAIKSPQRGLFVIGNGRVDTPPAPQENDQQVLDNALAAIAALEKLVNRLRQESSAMEAVRKLLGAR